jgi:hypothetical protein
VLKEFPGRVDVHVLSQFPEYEEFRTRTRRRKNLPDRSGPPASEARRDKGAGPLGVQRGDGGQPTFYLSDGRPAEVDLPGLIREVSVAKSYARWLRDCARALMVGAASVMLTFLLAGTVIQGQVFVALEVLCMALVFGGWLAERRSCPPVIFYPSGRIGQFSVKNTSFVNFITALLAITAVGHVIVYAETAHWPIDRYTSQWWEIIGLALFYALLGAGGRALAVSRIEQNHDISRRLKALSDQRGS